MIDINTAKSNIENVGFLDIEIDVNIDLFAEIERLKSEKNAIPVSLFKTDSNMKKISIEKMNSPRR